MRFVLLIVFLMVAWVSMDTSPCYARQSSQHQGILIKEITIDGFVLGDKERFAKLFKPYRNKYLTSDDMDLILQKIQVIYEREGYAQLVNISYKVIKHRLEFTSLMMS